MTYATMALPFLGLALATLATAAVLRRPDRRWWLATAATVVALVVLTIVFDNVMIAADLFRYDHSHLSGVRLGQAPVEDLAWPLVAGIGLPALALLLAPPEESQ
ncbi:lycopene cyclase [Xylanimonas oleitrophica]|uniref:Lycopene cyclase n=1 Tax=Xylanimonas oleitrophica TaxID=2607479 RepID=A0A2W5Y760_9MICO|nr:lycopene cyclase domain-containing protein [Xylanimonas oleitrophica]PZR54164.1 lycopene cyclase [Xylanimonas oleitrophica]